MTRVIVMAILALVPLITAVVKEEDAREVLGICALWDWGAVSEKSAAWPASVPSFPLPFSLHSAQPSTAADGFVSDPDIGHSECFL